MYVMSRLGQSVATGMMGDKMGDTCVREEGQFGPKRGTPELKKVDSCVQERGHFVPKRRTPVYRKGGPGVEKEHSH